MSTDTEQQARTLRADARMKKAAQQERDKEVAWAEIAASARHADENTNRLRALRLAKEQADAEAKAAEAVKKAPARKRKKAGEH